jgi:hypothetical protein
MVGGQQAEHQDEGAHQSAERDQLRAELIHAGERDVGRDRCAHHPARVGEGAAPPGRRPADQIGARRRLDLADRRSR